MLEIKTGNLTKSKPILVDGKSWTMNVLGAGDELKMSQAQRRIKQLEAKMKAGTATDDDYDKYDALENGMYNMFHKLFKDGTPDNHEVKEWLDETPFAIIQMAVEEVSKQADAKRESEEKNGGAIEPETSPRPTANPTQPAN